MQETWPVVEKPHRWNKSETDSSFGELWGGKLQKSRIRKKVPGVNVHSLREGRKLQRSGGSRVKTSENPEKKDGNNTTPACLRGIAISHANESGLKGKKGEPRLGKKLSYRVHLNFFELRVSLISK